MFGVVDVPARHVLLMVDLVLFPACQMSAVERSIGACFSIDRRLALLESRSLRGIQPA